MNLRKRVTGHGADILSTAFYAGVAAVALAGQTTAAVAWLHWPVETALPAVALLELGGIALAARADYRRRLGETALAARVLSAAVAVFAVVFNWVGHPDRLQGAFFAGMSALGYAVWLIQAGDRRRDQLRAAGMLPPAPPVYGWWRWLRRPAQTAQARALALAEGLDLYQSLAAAQRAREAEQEQVRQRRRQAAIAEVLHRKLRKATDPTTAQIAVLAYDLDEIARRLAEGADYDGLTRLIGQDLDPGRLLAPVDQAEPEPAPVAPLAPASAPVLTPVPPKVMANVHRVLTEAAKPSPPTAAPPRGRSSGRRKPSGGQGKRAAGSARRTAEETRQLAAQLRTDRPDITRAELARLLGISPTRLRQVERDESSATPINGADLLGQSEGSAAP